MRPLFTEISQWTIIVVDVYNLNLNSNNIYQLSLIWLIKVNMEKIESDFFTIKEFACKIGVHPNTVRRGIKSGRICAFKVGSGKRGAFRIAKTEINRIALFDMEEMIEKIIEKRKAIL